MESLARISTLIESARDLTIDAAQAARSTRSASKPLDRHQIKKLLDSRNDREVLDGLRRVISMMYRSQKTLPFFSSVVKNVASPTLEIKKLVYVYLVHHAEQEPDLALLSINTIQKSLSDPNPYVRALALRTMSGIRVPVISQIVALAIKKGAADMSPHVRRAAALAIPKCYRLEPAQEPVLVDALAQLLGDKQYFVAGAAVAAMEQVCPASIDLLHANYRSLVRKIVDMDEWSQLATLRMLTRYSRRCFPRRRRKPGRDRGEEAGRASSDLIFDPDLDIFLTAIKPLLQSRNSAVVVAVTRALLVLGNPAVHLGVAVGPLVALLRGPADTQQIALRSIVAVCAAHPAPFVRFATHFLVRATDLPAVWELKLEVLTLVFPHAPPRVKSLVLHELEHFARGSADPALVRAAVRAVGRCAQRSGDKTTAARCLRLLLSQITSLDGTLAGESLTVIRHLIQLDAQGHIGTVVRLAKNLDSATDPQARATIIWLVGEFAGLGGADNVAPDVLRILLKDFANEAEMAKHQILLLAAKVYLHHLNRESEASKRSDDNDGGGVDAGVDADATASAAPAPAASTSAHPIALLWDYALHLVRYDTSFDLRDRARMYRALVAVPQLGTLALLAEKPAVREQSQWERAGGGLGFGHKNGAGDGGDGLMLGSATLVLAGGGGGAGLGGLGLRGYEPLPDWVEEGREPDPRLRGEAAVDGRAVGGIGDLGGDVGSNGSGGGGEMSGMGPATATAAAAAAAGVATGVGAKTLDDWLAEGNEDGGGEDEEANEDETDEEDEEEEEEDDEDEEEEEEEDEEEEEEDETEEEESTNDEETDRLVNP